MKSKKRKNSKLIKSMQETGLGVIELGKRANVSPTTITKARKGEPIRKCNAKKIAEALKKPIHEVFSVVFASGETMQIKKP